MAKEVVIDMKQTIQNARKFGEDISGAISAFSLFVFLGLLMIGGLAIDVASLYQARTQLQVAADSTAHAALYVRVDQEDQATSLSGAVTAGKTAALSMASSEMPSGYYGTILDASDIEYGSWNSTTRTFTANPLSDEAVRVNTKRLTDNQNGISTFLLKLVGVSDWNVQTPAVFETFIPSCMRQGMVAMEMVDIQGNSVFDNGFCIHSNTHVKISSNNTFNNDTFVTMPEDDDLEIPASGMESNPGLWRAVDENAYLIRELNKLPGWIADLTVGKFDDPSTEVVEGLEMPSYIDLDITTGKPVVNTIAKNGFKPTDLVEGQINFIECNNSNNQLVMGSSGTGGNGNGNNATDPTEETVDANLFLKEMIIVTTCQLHFSSNAELHDMIIAIDNDTSSSIDSAGGLVLGKDDNCNATSG